MRRAALLISVALVSLAVGCAGPARTYQNVWIPPRIDLTEHETIGVVEFSTGAEGELGTFASQRFTEAARRDQGLVRMLDLGTSEQALHSVGGHDWNVETFRALGEQTGVRTLLVGELEISDVKPNLAIGAALRSGTLSAEVSARLHVQLVETATGASLWSRVADARRTVAHVSVAGGRDVVFDAQDPAEAYGPLVDSLVAQVTRDFQGWWERR